MKILVADEHPIVGEGISALLRDAGHRVLGRCTDGEQVLQALESVRPDVIVSEARLPKHSGLEILRRVKRLRLAVRVVLLSASISGAQALEAVRLGVDGLILKESEAQELIECLDEVGAGRQWFGRRAMQRALDAAADTGNPDPLAGLLTPREIEIVRAAAAGHRSKAIAKAFGITEGTVKLHLHNIYRKTGVGNRTELAIAARDGLLYKPAWKAGLKLMVFLGWAFAALSAAAAPRPMAAFEFAQGVVVDPGRAAAFVMSPGGGIDKLDLNSGAVTARSDKGEKPLLVEHGIVLAQAATAAHGRLDLVGLGVGALKLRFSTAITLPRHAAALIDDRLGETFAAAARRDDGGSLVIWQFARQLVSGIPSRTPPRVEKGFARLDDKGHLLAAEAGDAPPPAQDEARMPAALRALVDKGAVAGRPCRIDGVLAAAVFHEKKNGITAVVLRRWDDASGKELPERRLFGPELTFQQVSADCRDLFASRGDNGWQWSIYGLEDGRRIGQLPMPVPGALFFVWGKSVIYRASAEGRLVGGRVQFDRAPELRAVDLRTGAVHWARPIRDTRYRGPFPGIPPGGQTR